MMLSIFSCTFLPSVCLLWKNVFLDILPIFKYIVCFGVFWVFCILGISWFSDLRFANIFPHSVGFLVPFYFINRFLNFAEVFSMIFICLVCYIYLFLLVLLFTYFLLLLHFVRFKKSSPRPMSRSLSSLWSLLGVLWFQVLNWNL